MEIDEARLPARPLLLVQRPQWTLKDQRPAISIIVRHSSVLYIAALGALAIPTGNDLEGPTGTFHYR